MDDSIYLFTVDLTKLLVVRTIGEQLIGNGVEGAGAAVPQTV
jgi:hypothetical protein